MQNYNLLPVNSFDLRVDSLPDFSFYAQEVSFPEIVLQPVTLGFQGTEQSFAGSAKTYGDLTITMKLDANLDNYKEIYSWFSSQLEGQVPTYRDISFFVLTPSSTFNKLFVFRSAFPYTIGGMQFTTAVGNETQYLSVPISFKFSEIIFDGT